MNIKSIFEEVLPVIQKFAPTIASVISSPFGVGAGYIIPLLATAFGTNPTNIKQIASSILSDPAAQDKLESIEKEYGGWLEALVMRSVTQLSKAEINVKLEWQDK